MKRTRVEKPPEAEGMMLHTPDLGPPRPPGVLRSVRRTYTTTEADLVEAETFKMTSPSLEEQVYNALRDAIIVGQYRPGDRLVESQLSEHFGISKTPVREALIRLKRDGLVANEMRRTTRVATPTADDIRAACELRTWVEGALAARCAEDPSPQFRGDLRTSIEQAEAALGADDLASYGEAIRRFSDIVVNAVDNRFAREVLEQLRNVLALIAHMSRETSGRLERSIAEHRAIYDAIAAGDPDGARKATSTHMQSIERDSLAALQHHLEATG